MKNDKLVIATKNKGKTAEFKKIFEPRGIDVLTLADVKELPEINETGSTFLENAMIKAEIVSKHTNLPVLADDSGLIVDALDGAPGVHSARYAGDHDDIANNQKLLRNLDGIPIEKRTARFHTTLVLMWPDGSKLVSNGEIAGIILKEPQGNNGFGYDPLFYVSEKKKRLAQMSQTEKNEISHRGRATVDLMTKFDSWWRQK